jgi:hypothetical protein
MSIKFSKDRSPLTSLEVGAKVRALGGPFVGRIGVVSKVDGKGGARVTFGLLSARVLLNDLGPFETKGRPSLKTSHWRAEPRGADDVPKEAGRSKKNRSTRRKPNP